MHSIRYQTKYRSLQVNIHFLTNCTSKMLIKKFKHGTGIIYMDNTNRCTTLQLHTRPSILYACCRQTIKTLQCKRLFAYRQSKCLVMTFVMTRIHRVLSLSTLNKYTNSVKRIICYHSVCSFVVYGKNIERICFMTMDTRMILYRCFLLLFNPSPDISFLDFFSISILIYLKRASAL